MGGIRTGLRKKKKEAGRPTYTNLARHRIHFAPPGNSLGDANRIKWGRWLVSGWSEEHEDRPHPDCELAMDQDDTIVCLLVTYTSINIRKFTC